MAEQMRVDEATVKQYERVCTEEQIYEERIWKLFCAAFFLNIITFALIKLTKFDPGVVLLVLFLFSSGVLIDMTKQRFSALKARAKKRELEKLMNLTHMDFTPVSWGEKLLFPNSPSNATVGGVFILVFLNFVFLLLWVIYGKVL